MATVNLGKIKLKWRGTYAGGTTYTPDDVIEYTDGSITSTYICVTESTGNAPSSEAQHIVLGTIWQKDRHHHRLQQEVT